LIELLNLLQQVADAILSLDPLNAKSMLRVKVSLSDIGRIIIATLLIVVVRGRKHGSGL
jgi:hypothetical protein